MSPRRACLLCESALLTIALGFLRSEHTFRLLARLLIIPSLHVLHVERLGDGDRIDLHGALVTERGLDATFQYTRPS